MLSLSDGDRYQATKQRIPSLEQVLEAAKQSNISIMFDLRPENHSDYQSFVNATLEVILQSGIPLQQVSSHCHTTARPCCHTLPWREVHLPHHTPHSHVRSLLGNSVQAWGSLAGKSCQ